MPSVRARARGLVFLLAACKASAPIGVAGDVPTVDSSGKVRPSDAGALVADEDELHPTPREAEPNGADGSREASADPDAGASSEAISPERAEEILFAEPAGNTTRRAACPASAGREDRVRCLLALRYAADPIAGKIAVDLFDRTGDVAGTHPDVMVDGGYRGRLHLVPALAAGAERRHLEWIAGATRDYDAFFAGLGVKASEEVRYRARSIVFRVFRSEKRRTPSAYAEGWSISYNVAGSLNTSADAVRETLFHEIFHLNDAAHGHWSDKALGPLYDAIVARCGTDTRCLRPYAPNSTLVRGGTYYAFQPGNGVGEYAAELAIRYYRETRAALMKQPLAEAPFRCGQPEDARAWELIAREFFGAVDVRRSCSSHAD